MCRAGIVRAGAVYGVASLRKIERSIGIPVGIDTWPTSPPVHGLVCKIKLFWLGGIERALALIIVKGPRRVGRRIRPSCLLRWRIGVCRMNLVWVWRPSRRVIPGRSIHWTHIIFVKADSRPKVFRSDLAHCGSVVWAREKACLILLPPSAGICFGALLPTHHSVSLEYGQVAYRFLGVS